MTLERYQGYARRMERAKPSLHPLPAAASAADPHPFNAELRTRPLSGDVRQEAA